MPEIDFEKIVGVARLGINRASIFLGFGVNSARDPDFNNYNLTNETKIEIVGSTDDKEVLKLYKAEYESWIIANGFRELIETFALFLEEVHKACLTLSWSKGKYTPNECDEMQTKYHGHGLPDKFNILEQRFRVFSDDKKHILSINGARNCLTHRYGKVGKKDLDETGKLKITWRDLDIIIAPAGAEPISITDIPKEGLPTPNGGYIETNYVERQLVFNEGEYLNFSTRQLAEICWFINETAIQICNSAVEFAGSNGIEVRNRKELDRS